MLDYVRVVDFLLLFLLLLIIIIVCDLVTVAATDGCRECLGEAHEPASCDNWNSWHQKIAEVKPEQCLYCLPSNSNISDTSSGGGGGGGGGCSRGGGSTFIHIYIKFPAPIVPEI